jgi:anti-sigma regulatory factor (Ser/Thr protein kinase)
VTTVINVPPSLDDVTFEQVLEQLAPLQPDQKILLDARHTRWASPYGLTALLALAQSRETKPIFAAPEEAETLSYWSRTGFFKYARDLYELRGTISRARAEGESNVLLGITPITQSGDVHEAVEHIQQRAQDILVRELKLDPTATMRFGMTFSEACQNVIEHAGRGGWVAVQAYTWRQRLKRRVVVISVCDAGMGFRRSLESAHARRPSDRWDDAMALEDALIRGVSRFSDRGRGQGLAQIRRFVGIWDGKLTIRSGTARIGIIPSWDEDVPLTERLSPFPGTQMQIIIPERLAERAAERTGGASPRRGNVGPGGAP